MLRLCLEMKAVSRIRSGRKLKPSHQPAKGRPANARQCENTGGLHRDLRGGEGRGGVEARQQVQAASGFQKGRRA